jgi:hypothetical protein
MGLPDLAYGQVAYLHNCLPTGALAGLPCLPHRPSFCAEVLKFACWEVYNRELGTTVASSCSSPAVALPYPTPSTTITTGSLVC